MTKLIPVALFALICVSCQSVYQSSDPYYRDGVYTLHDGGHILNDESSDIDTSYYDDYVLPTVGAEEAISPYSYNQSYLGYSGNQLYSPTGMNDSYLSGGYSSYNSMNSPFFQSCGMGMSWGALFGSSYYPNTYYPPAGTNTTGSNNEFGTGYINLPRTHQLYTHSSWEPSGNRPPTNIKGIEHLGLDFSPNSSGNTMQRGFGAWMMGVGMYDTGHQEGNRSSGFQNFMKDLGRGLENVNSNSTNRSNGGAVRSGSGSSGKSSGGAGRSGGSRPSRSPSRR